ncbi:MAG: hypothetical protein U0736_17565 [Gemmataceae bacterium]
MPPNAGVHPSPAQLAAFALGRLAEDASDPIAEHLAGAPLRPAGSRDAARHVRQLVALGPANLGGGEAG